MGCPCMPPADALDAMFAEGQVAGRAENLLIVLEVGALDHMGTAGQPVVGATIFWPCQQHRRMADSGGTVDKGAGAHPPGSASPRL